MAFTNVRSHTFAVKAALATCWNANVTAVLFLVITWVTAAGVRCRAGAIRARFGANWFAGARAVLLRIARMANAVSWLHAVSVGAPWAEWFTFVAGVVFGLVAFVAVAKLRCYAGSVHAFVCAEWFADVCGVSF